MSFENPANELTAEQRELFTAVFNHIDANNDGFLVFDELKNAVLKAVEVHGKQVSETQARKAAERALSDCDKDQDAKVDLDEWLEFFGKVAHLFDDASLAGMANTFGFDASKMQAKE